MMLEPMQTFVDLVDTGSFSRTATRNHITQSAVSQRIRKLESDLGQQLVVRRRERVEVTEAGKVFWAACKEILARYDLALDEFHRLQNLVTGTLKVAAVQSIGLHELPPYVAEFLRAYPDADLHLEYRRAAEIYQGIRDLSLDLGLVAHPSRDPQVEILPFRHDEMILICRPDHELTRLKSLPLNTLDGQRFIGFGPNTPSGNAVARLLRRSGVRVRMSHQFDNVETIKRAVEVGTGVAIVPRPSVENEIAAGSLVGMRFRGRRWERPLAILHKRGHPLSMTARRFLELLTGDSEPALQDPAG
jgi:DNA-binding transcriptional LysR family regulator